MHEAVSIARDLIAIPSVNPMGTGLKGAYYSERNVAEYIVKFFESFGIASAMIGRDQEHPNVIAQLDIGAPETVLLEAHMDTQPPENMSIDPFDPIICNGKLYGRGACDTKASLAAYLYAFKSLAVKNAKLKRNIIFAAVHDEEYSFGGARELATSGIEATFAIAGEPTSLNIIYAHKGVCRFYITTHGLGAHGALPWLGQNAIYAMAGVLEGVQHYAESLSAVTHPELGEATINVGKIQGGDTVNTVPSTCRIEIDHRLLPGDRFQKVRANLTPFLDRAKGNYIIHEPYMQAPGVYTPRTSRPCVALREASEACGWIPEFRTAHYSTDASILCSSGIPTIVFGPGSIEQAHTAEEFVSVEELERAASIIIRLLEQSA